MWSVRYATYSMSVKTRHHASNIRLKNHRKDVKDPKVILADKRFLKSGHRFKKHARLTIIDRQTNTHIIQRENF